jgi:hypothetical protein
VELEELCARVARVVDDRATEARKLSMMVMGISNVLVDLRILPIQDIAQLPENGSGGLGSGWSHPGAPTRVARFQRRSVGLNSSQPPPPCFLGYHAYHFLLFFSFGMAIIYILTFIYIHIGKLVPLHPCVPGSQTAASQGPWTQFRHAAPPWWGRPP